MRSSDGEGRSIRSDALYPALSGEWEVPVTRNAEIDPGDNDPPPKMTQGGNDPPNPPSSPSTASVHAGEILLGPNYLLLCPRHLPLGAQFQKPLVVHVIGRLTPLQVKIDDGAHARPCTESGKNTAPGN